MSRSPASAGALRPLAALIRKSDPYLCYIASKGPDKAARTRDGTELFTEEDAQHERAEMEQLFEEARKESVRIMTRRLQERESVKQELTFRREAAQQEAQYHRKYREALWKHRMRKSPFVVDLLAQAERTDEEKRVGLRRARQQEAKQKKRMERVKNDIILKALSETSDLEALREEKRAILLQEKRLRALLDLEKAKLKRKEDLLAAKRAERQRREAKLRHRRELRSEEEKQKQLEMEDILREKHDLPPVLDEHEQPVPVPTEPFDLRVGRGVMGSLGGRHG